MIRKINKNMSVTEKINIIRGMMENMNAADRELMNEKLLSYILFDTKDETKDKTFAETKKGLEHIGLSEEDLKLIKELAKRTENLRNLLGDNPNLFM
ncbi:MAG: hypothetical protein ABIT08_08320 [Bacteroidia bacterium]